MPTRMFGSESFECHLHCFLGKVYVDRQDQYHLGLDTHAILFQCWLGRCVLRMLPVRLRCPLLFHLPHQSSWLCFHSGLTAHCMRDSSEHQPLRSRTSWSHKGNAHNRRQVQSHLHCELVREMRRGGQDTAATANEHCTPQKGAPQRLYLSNLCLLLWPLHALY